VEIVVAITGASGVIIGVRLLEALTEQGVNQVHLLVSAAAEGASSSCAPEAMVVAPCSMKTLSAIAHGYADDLIVRVAEIMLRMGRRLVLMPRETPLSLPAIENLRLAKLAGAIILPPVVAYYPRPRTVDDITDFFVGKVLDVLGLGHDLYRRWELT
jgi:4-hydroxy-3-polyprenylbenzoate decarboxylase